MSRKMEEFNKDFIQNLVGSALRLENFRETFGRTLENTFEAWNRFHVRRGMIFYQAMKESKKLYKYNNRYLWEDVHG